MLGKTGSMSGKLRVKENSKKKKHTFCHRFCLSVFPCCFLLMKPNRRNVEKIRNYQHTFNPLFQLMPEVFFLWRRSLLPSSWPLIWIPPFFSSFRSWHLTAGGPSSPTACRSALLTRSLKFVFSEDLHICVLCTRIAPGVIVAGCSHFALCHHGNAIKPKGFPLDYLSHIAENILHMDRNLKQNFSLLFV